MCTEQLIFISSKSAYPSNGKYAEFAGAYCDGTVLQICKGQQGREAAWMEKREKRTPELEFGNAEGGMQLGAFPSNHLGFIATDSTEWSKNERKKADRKA
ncbi:hypothetical protein GRJ2_002306500 [Grus japonensis]|uniref:Uncharacterized protein n=1 Tax=Grus japonensis TaxID=30415 RepID=A0ABC9XM45_GRUJA